MNVQRVNEFRAIKNFKSIGDFFLKHNKKHPKRSRSVIFNDVAILKNPAFPSAKIVKKNL